MYYRYAQKWIDIFHEQPLMIKVETGFYIKGMHNLLNAHFDLRNFDGFEIALQQLKICSNRFGQSARQSPDTDFCIYQQCNTQPAFYAWHF